VGGFRGAFGARLFRTIGGVGGSGAVGRRGVVRFVARMLGTDSSEDVDVSELEEVLVELVEELAELDWELDEVDVSDPVLRGERGVRDLSGVIGGVGLRPLCGGVLEGDGGKEEGVVAGIVRASWTRPHG
jgi:hypothetical protein